MYAYTDIDKKILGQRVIQFRGQMDRFIKGELAPAEFLPLRLQNGLYIQRHAPMLRLAVPYGLLSSAQLRMLAHVARHYDKGYGHVTTRTNIQFMWPRLTEVPSILAELATVGMHSIQTSGNCVRNTTTDQFAGVAADELMDPRPYCEIIRQWSTFHPEFAFLPRKFKIAVNSAKSDRAAILIHDIALELTKNDAGEVGYRVFVGGGLGRTPCIAALIREFLPEKHLLTYLESIIRTYNLLGRRDNKHKARIKILVKALGPEGFAEKVEKEWALVKDGPATLTEAEIERVKKHFSTPDYKQLDETAVAAQLEKLAAEDKAFANWMSRNVHPHKQAGYRIVTLSLKPTGVIPGDVSDKQFDAIADLADEYSFGEARTTHFQNIVLADIDGTRLHELWKKIKPLGFAAPNIGTLNDIICCPGGSYCALANAKSIPVAEAIQRKFDDLDYLYDLGDIELNISGCMNACGHHHVGNIGILGVDKKGAEFYQISLGGFSGKNATLGDILGPSFSQDDVPLVIEKILNVYVENRLDGESFIETYRRIGIDQFKERAYA
ncbi:MAG: nitrite/sulfite reductase [Pseudomonadales bacterium]